MSKILKEITRRNLLRYVGNAVVFAPFMRTLAETQAFGDDAAPKRALFFYYPNGIIPDKFHPQAGPLNALNDMTSPLARVKNDIIILRDTDYKTANSHQGGMNYALTGMPDQKPAISIDTVLGNKFKGALPVMRFGIASHWDGGLDAQSCSYLAPGQVALREDNPSKAFQTLFGGAAPMTPASPSAPPVSTTGVSAKNKISILDDNLEQIKGLQGKLASIEKVKLDAHIEAIRELERRVNGAAHPDMGGGGSGMSAQCSRQYNAKRQFELNDTNYPKTFQRPENVDVVTDMMVDIAIQAFACRITNVILFQNGHSVWEMPFGGGRPGSGRGHHSTSHYDAEGNVAEHILGQQYMMNKFANLVDGMSKCKEGDKSVLHNSISMAFSEFGDSAKHAFTNVGIVLAGRQGGYFVPGGQCISGKGASHNQTLVTILQSFGMTENTFGQADLGSGIIPGLKA